MVSVCWYTLQAWAMEATIGNYLWSVTIDRGDCQKMNPQISFQNKLCRPSTEIRSFCLTFLHCVFSNV